MRFDRVTWYSKLIAMILFIALPFIGFYLGMKYQEGTNPSITTIVEPSNGTTTKTVVKTDQVTIKTTYENEVLKYSGSVQLPTPCHEIKDETIILESYPEQVQIYLTTTLDPNKVCAQVITEKKFSGKVQVSEDATITVFLNNEQVN